MSRPDIVAKLQKHGLCRHVNSVRQLSGGCISSASCYHTDQGMYFVKMHSDPQALTWFRSEFVSLMLINELVPGFAPKPYLYDRLDGSGAFLVTEYIDLGGPRSLEVQRELGRRLARLHQPLQQDIVLSYNDPDEGPVQTVIESGKFGFPFPTYCGSTEQPNKWHDGDWATFWQEQRLAPMFERLKHDKELYELGQRLIEVTPSLLVTSDGPITPSLLHGNGNWGVRKGTNEPVIYDPACYFGHHEAEMGIMRMFGGFSKVVYSTYREHLATSPENEHRMDMYELYHHLNHCVIFGPSYRPGAMRLIRRLLSAASM